MVDLVRASEHPDIVLLGVHAGLGRGTNGEEDMVYDIATKVSGIDAILFGHSHQQLEPTLLGQTFVVQPKNWAISLAKIDLVVERNGGQWKVVSKSGRLLPVTEQVTPDPAIVRIAESYHARTEAYLNQKITEAPATLSAARGRIEDTAVIDAIQHVQLKYAHADVSMTAVFNPRVTVPKGPVTIRQIAALYIYDNELFAIEGNGRMVREALENAARYFKSCVDPACSNTPLINRDFFGFNFDIAQGVSYDVDLTEPAGQRIRNITFKGKPLADSQPLRLAVNNYRAGGSAGYSMFKGAKILWRSYEDIRDLIVRYYSEGHTLPVTPDNNWRIVPEAAREKLGTEIQAEAMRTREM
jgi:2',3'-cyclic-nucleotide 2'-phosphodiesterase/3'-nucleotidase